MLTRYKDASHVLDPYGSLDVCFGKPLLRPTLVAGDLTPNGGLARVSL